MSDNRPRRQTQWVSFRASDPIAGAVRERSEKTGLPQSEIVRSALAQVLLPQSPRRADRKADHSEVGALA